MNRVQQQSVGQITTFYSYKGGVGRTMAVANVAYMAAFAGKRVLVMDWDLEAPGLIYYFRGMLTPAEYKQLKSKPGILNILCKWQEFFSGTAKDTEAIEKFVLGARSGEYFNECVSNIANKGFLPNDGCLHYMGPGSEMVQCPGERSYEDALARFSWPSFFEATNGGILLSLLRGWSKQNYDHVLIDSRTGLADVAGLCTIQLPDTVAICFALNRQNIDGAAKVAGAISAHRKDAVRVHAVPMRVARENTSEESDATARAVTTFVRVANMSAEKVQADFRRLKIPQTDGVPFYETLSAFSDNRFDPLSLGYAELAFEVLGIKVEKPTLDKDLISLVRSRSAPRSSTSDYLETLRNAEPSRAYAELQILLENALDPAADEGPVTPEYVLALVATIFSMPAAEVIQAISLQRQALALIRKCATEFGEGEWNHLLRQYLELHLNSMSFILDPEEELSLLDELDEVLSVGDSSAAATLKRVSLQRRALKLCASMEQTDTLMQRVGLLKILVKEARRLGATDGDASKEVLAAELDAALYSGNAQRAAGKTLSAINIYEEAIQAAERDSLTGELRNLKSQLHLRLGVAFSDSNAPHEAIDNILEAATLGGGSFDILQNFADSVRMLIRCDANADQLSMFCTAALPDPQRIADRKLQNLMLARASRQSIDMLETLLQVAVILTGEHSGKHVRTLELIANAADQVLRALFRRRPSLNSRYVEQISNDMQSLKVLLLEAGVFDPAMPGWSLWADTGRQ